MGNKKQNVVLIVMDTVRSKSFCRSNTKTKSKNNSFFSNSTSCVQAFSAAPWTLPSHASLLTGVTSSRHGAHAGHKHLDSTLITLPEVLQDHGYETVGVSNNTWISEEFGFNQGFETFHKNWQYIQSDTDLGKIAQTEEGIDIFTEAAKEVSKGNPITNIANAIYGQFFRRANDDGTARTNKWINDWVTTRDDSRPFFLFVNYLEPHLEYQPPEPYAREHLPKGVSYKEAMNVSQDAWGYITGKVKLTSEDFEILRALYRAEISYLEVKIEEVIDLLKTEYDWDDTLFIITSDHGENIGDHDLMDHQYSLYDTLLHVPLYVHGGPFESSKIDNIIQLHDIPPTIIDCLDINAPEARKQFQGISFHPNAKKTREYAMAEYMAPQPSMDALETKIRDLPEHIYKYDRSLRAIRTDKYKYIRGSDGSQELYDIQNDYAEQNDIVSIEKGVVKRLDSTIDDWLDSFEQAKSKNSVSMDEDTKSRLEDLGYLQ